MSYKKITTSTNGVFTVPTRILGVRLVAGSVDAATAVLYDSLTQTGDDFCKLSAVAGGTDRDRFGEGLLLNKGLSVTLTGTSPILYIYYE